MARWKTFPNILWTAGRKLLITSVMARCYQCGSQTGLYPDGSSLCASCDGKIGVTPRRATAAELNARLKAARDEYRRAMGAQREAFELKRALAPNNPDGSMAMRNANFQVELAAAKYRQALRDFVSALARRSD
jgi:uncharacterized Zn finger protein (UPF0148 family)